MHSFGPISKNNDHFNSEVVINDTPIGARNILTKGYIQDEISQRSGAAISTRGRYIAKTDLSKNPADKPLYLYIQGPTKQSIETAIHQIDEIIRNEVGVPLRPNFNRQNDTCPPETKMQVEKIFVGLDNLPPTFDLRNKILGQGDSNLQYIRSETGAAVVLRGRGSQFVDPQLGHEGPEPMHLYIEHTQADGMIAARQLAMNLIETLQQELHQTADIRQGVNMPSNQVIGMQNRMVGLPPLSVPPPQQQFAAVQQQQANQTIEQPVILSNPSDRLQGQIHIRNQQQIQQLGQPPQQVILQQPPPLARAPIVNIPPPGVHIPQHAGPMVPPPQIVQLSAPPPTAVSTANVLVVAPPPSQSITYLPPELNASSSSGSFSFLQGGVLYHQAPPIQTQAQIGDGLHIISAPPQNNANISMHSHARPPPQMIITQVQIEPNQGASDQFQQPQVSQHQKTQFHVIGHVQGTINQDQGNIQPGQAIVQNRDFQNMDNFTRFTINNQTSAPSSLVLTLPYHITSSVTTSTATMPITQNQQMQLSSVSQTMTMSNPVEQDSMKQISRQILHPAHLTQPQHNDRTSIAVQIQAPGNQQPMEQMILSQPPNGPIINQISHIPPNQIITQLPPGQMQTNNYMQNQVMVSQEVNQINNPQIAQLPPNQMTINQMPSVHIQNQIGSDAMNQQMNMQAMAQMPRQPNQQFNQMNYDHPRDNRNRMNQGNRNRKPTRNRMFPWNKNEQDKQKYQHDWSKRENERNFDYDCQGDDRKTGFRNSSDGDRQFDDKSNSQNQRYYDKNDKSHDGSNNWGKSEDDSDSGRKRKYDSESNKWNRSDDKDGRGGDSESDNHHTKRRFDKDNNWSSRSENNQKSSSRFEYDESNKTDLGLQKSSSNRGKAFGSNDQSKPDRETTSKWSDQSGESLRGDDSLEKKFDDDGQNDQHGDGQGDNDGQNDIKMEKHNEGSQNMLIQKTSWSDTRSDFKGNVQYATAGQFHGQNVDSKQYNSNFQGNYGNSVQMYQGNIPYLLPPPPPPPPQNQLQFNATPPNHITNPNMQIVGSIPQSMAQNQIINQAVMPNQGMISSQMVPNVPFDLNQTIMGSIPQSMATSIQQSIPPVIAQNNLVNVQNQPSILPSSSNIVQQNLGQNIPAYMSQSMPTTVTHHVGQSVPMIGSSITSSANQIQTMPPIMNQNIPPNLVPSMIATNTTNVTHTMPMSIPNNMGQNISLSMQPVIGQMSMAVNPTMVPPPTMIHGSIAQSVPNMVPPPVMPPRPQQMSHSVSMAPPPPPPPPSVQTMSSQSPYPYWMG